MHAFQNRASTITRSRLYLAGLLGRHLFVGELSLDRRVPTPNNSAILDSRTIGSLEKGEIYASPVRNIPLTEAGARWGPEK
jgi:hypothetical protein